MSKTVRTAKTKGYLDRIEHQRRDRKLARDFKTLLIDTDYEIPCSEDSCETPTR